MQSINPETLLTLAAAIIAFVASVIATAVTAYNARFRRFTQQRWWEMKIDVYSRIVEALASLIYYYDQIYSAELVKTQLSDERREEINIFWNQGHLELKRAAAAGTFVVSPAAAAALRQLWSEERHKGIHSADWLSAIEADYAAAEECLRTVVAAAHEDLGTHPK